MDAYDVQAFQISGGPAWIDTETYDVVARTGGNLNNADRDRMLQSLLTDRFKLKIRRESKQGTVYQLETAKKGPKITASPAGTQYGMNTRRNLFTGTQIPMDVFASILSSYIGEPVIDKTELKGGFDITFRYSPGAKSDDVSAASIFTEVEDQLVRLVAKKGPIEMLVVESAERPSAN